MSIFESLCVSVYVKICNKHWPLVNFDLNSDLNQSITAIACWHFFASWNSTLHLSAYWEIFIWNKQTYGWPFIYWFWFFLLFSPSLGGSGTSADGTCLADDIECNESHDRLGMEAIRSLHQQLDDDENGNIDLSESDDVR